MLVGFKVWKRLQLNETPESELVKCPDCMGEGIIYDECDCCGHEQELDCELCETKGKVAWGELNSQEKEKHLSFDRYIEVAIQEAKALANWRGVDPVQQAIELGLAPFQYRSNGSVQFMHPTVAEI